MPSPSTKSVLTIGEEGLSNSIQRLGNTDFFSVVTRKPKICDHKPVVVEAAVARLAQKKQETTKDNNTQEESIQLLRFANRVPLQFDKSSCAITKSVESVNWRAYGLSQSKNNLPSGPYVFAISITSPFIKFKNASKETIDASEELVDEIRKALMQAGQKLSRHIRKEQKAIELERKMQYIEKFVPILIKKLGDITSASSARIKRAEKGITKILGRDTRMAEKALKEAQGQLAHLNNKQQNALSNNTTADLKTNTNTNTNTNTKQKTKKTANKKRKNTENQMLLDFKPSTNKKLVKPKKTRSLQKAHLSSKKNLSRTHKKRKSL